MNYIDKINKYDIVEYSNINDNNASKKINNFQRINK